MQELIFGLNKKEKHFQNLYNFNLELLILLFIIALRIFRL